MTKSQILTSKIKSAAALSRIIAAAKAKGKRVVFTNGCFDIIHVGHIDYLAKASKMGDILVIGLNSDLSVRRLKGRGRPINIETARAKVLSAFYFVDYVTIFNEDTPERLIRNIKPDIMVKGGDWQMKDIVGASFVKSRGGKVATIPFVEGYSTTGILKRMRE